MLRPRLAAIAATLALAACTADVPASERGGRLFRDPRGISNSTFNAFSCATCHQTTSYADPSRIDAGASLWGAAARDGYWGGNVIRLLEAVNTCVVYFMRGDEIDESSVAARELYEYLLSVTPPEADEAVLPMTVVENVVPVALGDPIRGEVVYRAACRSCHGEAHSGVGGIVSPPRILPEYATESYPTDFPGVAPSLVVIEKIRHGRFFDIGGVMSLYSAESLTDGQVGDMLAFLGLDPG